MFKWYFSSEEFKTEYFRPCKEKTRDRDSYGYYNPLYPSILVLERNDGKQHIRVSFQRYGKGKWQVRFEDLRWFSSGYLREITNVLDRLNVKCLYPEKTWR